MLQVRPSKTDGSKGTGTAYKNGAIQYKQRDGWLYQKRMLRIASNMIRLSK